MGCLVREMFAALTQINLCQIVQFDLPRSWHNWTKNIVKKWIDFYATILKKYDVSWNQGILKNNLVLFSRFLIIKGCLPNLLETALLCQIFVFWVRDFKFGLLAYFLNLFDCAKFQKDWTTFILDILQWSPLWCFFMLCFTKNLKGGPLQNV